MKNRTTVSLISGFIGLAGVLLAPAAMSAPGKGWDAFNAGQGDPIIAGGQNVNTSNSGSAGKGWDVFRMASGAPIPVANKDYKGTSSGASAGKGWDVFFYTGEGEKP